VEEEGRLHDTVWGFAALGQNAVDWVGHVEHVGGRNGTAGGMKPTAVALAGVVHVGGWPRHAGQKMSQTSTQNSSNALGPIGDTVCYPGRAEPWKVCCELPF
jgi:hypothetical protein